MPKKQPVSKQTASITDEQLEQLRALLPQAFSEGKIDFDKLRASLGNLTDEKPERYSFSWAGKRDAIRLLQTSSRATLRPAPKESVDFDKTQNLFIEGDNLEVLKLLYKPYFGQVKMIYIDPPYNTGNDFVYPDNFADPLDTYLKLTGQKDGQGNLLTSNAETSGRYHSAWLCMMYPRLFLARQLLAEDGAIFISLDDHEIHNLRFVMNEIFGEENFIACVVWQKRTSPDARLTLGAAHDYILVYARSLEMFKAAMNLLPLNEERLKEYKNPDNDPRGAWASRDITGQTGHATPSQFYELTTPSGIKYSPPSGRCWTMSKKSYERLVEEGRIWFGSDGKSRPRLKLYLSESEGKSSWTWWTNKEVGHNQEATKEVNELLGVGDVFDNPKPVRLIKRIIQLSTEGQDEDIILDFFAGSCTTAQAVLELNREDGGDRRFIMVQLPEPVGPSSPALLPKKGEGGLARNEGRGESGGFATIAEIGKERIRRVIKKMKKEREGQMKLDKAEDLGFKVFKLAESNYKQWQGEGETPEALVKQMKMFADPLVEGWKPENVIYEVALKEGYGLNIRIEGTKVKDVEQVSDPDKGQSFYICLANKVKLEGLKPLGLKKDDLFICRDIALNDEAAANLALQCRLKTI